MSLTRRLRAAAVLAVLWGAVWAVAGAVLGVYRVRHGGIDFDWVRSGGDVLRFVLPFAAAWGGVGALHGLAFAGVLAALGRRAGPRAVTPLRVAGSGALAGLIPVSVYLVRLAASATDVSLMPGVLVLLLGGTTVGGLCALGTLGLAGGRSQLAPPPASGAPAT